MADAKISALTNLTAADPTNDMIPIVDVSDTPPASGNTKRISINNILSSSPTASGALTVTGLVTAGSTTITGALTVDTTTLVANAAGYADRVGIGTATPGAALEVSGSATNVFIRSTDTNDSALRYYVNGTEVAVCRGKNGNSYAIETAGAESFRINSTGNIVLKGGTAAANGVGVTFPATQVDSSDANCLDDYEEGTWDASFASGGGTVTINTALNRCRYTKIGRLVTVSGLIQVSSVSSPTGPLLISGLPFTIPAATEGDTYSAASLMADNLEITATGQIVGYGLPSSTNIYLYRYQAGAIIGLAPSAKATSEFTFTLTYSV